MYLRSDQKQAFRAFRSFGFGVLGLGALFRVERWLPSLSLRLLLVLLKASPLEQMTRKTAFGFEASLFWKLLPPQLLTPRGETWH